MIIHKEQYRAIKDYRMPPYCPYPKDLDHETPRVLKTISSDQGCHSDTLCDVNHQTPVSTTSILDIWPKVHRDAGKHGLAARVTTISEATL